MKLSVIIPHRGPALGLWSTIHACEAQLVKRSDYEFVVVTNGEPLDADTSACIGELKRVGKLVHVHRDEPLSPPVARTIGVDASSGQYLFFFDNHCIPCERYFDRALMDFSEKGSQILHSSVIFNAGSATGHHYKLRLAYNFWAEYSFLAQDFRPYKAAAAGHGGFAVDRDVWAAIDGYGPSSLLKGYAGEELLFDLKAWRMGYSVDLDPKLVHYHFAGQRSYSRHFTDEYYTNLLSCACAIGGEKWMYKVFDSYLTNTHIRLNAKAHWYDILQEAHNRAAQYAVVLDSVSKYSLDEVLEMFRVNGVAT